MSEAFKSNNSGKVNISPLTEEYNMLFMVLLLASKLYTHTSLKLRWKKHFIYEDLCKKIVRQLEKSLWSNWCSREYLENKGKRRLMEQHSL